MLNSIIGKDIIDFGSGYGGFLMQAKPFTKNILGIELDVNVKPIYEKNDIPLVHNLDDTFGIMGGDLLTAFHVVEHLSDPITTLKQLASLLKPNGKMIVEVPNADDALLTIYKNKAFSEFTYWSPHLYLYNSYTLKMLAQKAGLKVDFVKCIQRYPISNTLYWLSNNLSAGHKAWGGFLESTILQEAYESVLASIGATDTIIAQFRKN